MPTERDFWKEFYEKYPETRSLIERLQAGAYDSSEPLVILAGEATGIIGSVQIKCSCGRLVWIAPSTQELLKKRGDAPCEIVCQVCLKTEGSEQ